MPKQITRTLPDRKRIALVAHDHKKEDLIDWAVYNKKLLSKQELYATGTTGRLLSASSDRSARVWTLSQDKAPLVLAGHERPCASSSLSWGAAQQQHAREVEGDLILAGTFPQAALVGAA